MSGSGRPSTPLVGHPDRLFSKRPRHRPSVPGSFCVVVVEKNVRDRFATGRGVYIGAFVHAAVLPPGVGRPRQSSKP